ncbi:[protein-PII] uridylyltransferase [Thermodesulforhabdus norvegica]|uniref:Bifunctional uridylyltransferase/uridylyl-removing enzyme n=1 Tax=Thermodesulforhabdus norvegica TaxID=39841 RepID=A0A1I4V803_9BACT|nr:[protein-PII] uridylyltransferase [Thermodesulforhabdus norvegica]SFM97278.1 UTP--GlnB (protein PII) uridylyltransferase, GlnD [Thermodesulforhabdus norvegica]
MHCKSRPSSLQVVDQLSRIRACFREELQCGVSGKSDALRYARQVRSLLHDYFETMEHSGSWAVVGVGGLGRGEMSFFSDVDILFIYRRKLGRIFHEYLRDLTYGMWDAGFELGHNTASVNSLLKLAREDFSVLTSHLTSCFIAGSRELYLRWKNALFENFRTLRARRAFLKRLKEHISGRYARFGDSSYVLEPDIKEGPGGLRDIHAILWTSVVFGREKDIKRLPEGFLSSDELQWLLDAENFLWKVRLCLHRVARKHQDRLSLAEQKEVADLWRDPNFKGVGDGFHAEHGRVEQFMQELYRHTARVRRVLRFFLERVEWSIEPEKRKKSDKARVIDGCFVVERDHIRFVDPGFVHDEPYLLMKLFALMASRGLHFHHEVGKLVRENLHLVDGSALSDPRWVDGFFDVLTCERHGFEALKIMMETGLLSRFIPEFSGVRYRVQYDAYHVYTVDEHLLRTVRELYHLATEYDLPSGDRKVLYLAGLLHDIGKGKGKGHALRGAEMVRQIGERMNLEESELEDLVFLVKHHLLMAETALKRDLEDEKPVANCAATIGSLRRLDLLYLLTIADSRATGPHAWNAWKAALLSDLYGKVKRLLTQKDWTEDIAERIKVKKDTVLALCEEHQRQEISRWLNELSYRYLASQPPERILRHYFMEREFLKTRGVVFDARTSNHPMPAEEFSDDDGRSTLVDSTLWEINVVTGDRRGLFSIIAGVLWAHGVNVLSADIYTRSNGIAVDIITVNRVADPVNPERIFSTIRDDLQKAILDEAYLQHLIESRKPSRFIKTEFVPKRPDRVLVDESSSDFFTIVEVYTWDRPGVLYAITDELYKLGISIQLAKISTPGAQVADVFYVTDSEGQKLYDEKLYREIERRIIDRLRSLS